MEPAQFIGAVSDTLLCSICYAVMIRPRCCPEGHQFCFDCIREWLNKSKTCPSRCGALSKKRLTKLRPMEKLIGELEVQCLYASGMRRARESVGKVQLVQNQSKANQSGCVWEGPLSNRDRHLREHCLFSDVRCIWQDCNVSLPRHQLSAHEDSCQHREVSCKKCNSTLQAGDIDVHPLVCEYEHIECPHGCNETMFRKTLVEHEHSCDEALVSCSFAVAGCDVRAKRRKIGAHEEKTVAKHAELALRHAAQVSEENARIRGELKMARAQPPSCKRYSEKNVVWRIEGFSARAKLKGELRSRTFDMPTRAGTYKLRLLITFTRRETSANHGFLGLYVMLADEGQGCPDWPLSLVGTTFKVGHGPLPERSTITSAGAVLGNLRADDGKLETGFSALLGMDSSRGWSWVMQDKSVPAVNPVHYHDVKDMLRGDTLRIQSHVRAAVKDEESI